MLEGIVGTCAYSGNKHDKDDKGRIRVFYTSGVTIDVTLSDRKELEAAIIAYHEMK